VVVPKTIKSAGKNTPGLCRYGIILQQSDNADLVGAWWDVLCEGEVERMHLQDITPLRDKEGKCLKVVLK
jgi:hypothetical protein